jgi:hypothetical protein
VPVFLPIFSLLHLFDDCQVTQTERGTATNVWIILVKGYVYLLLAEEVCDNRLPTAGNALDGTDVVHVPRFRSSKSLPVPLFNDSFL